MLDLSSAFDTIDHLILFRRLESKFGITNNALKWIKPYLHLRLQWVSINRHHSPDIMYVTPLADIANRFGLSYHFYARYEIIQLGSNFDSIFA